MTAVGPPERGTRRLGRQLARSARGIRGDLPLAALDACLIVGAYTASLGFRFDFDVPARYWERFRVFLPVAVAVHLAMNLAFGGYGRAWRHASIDEARRLLGAGGVSTLLLLVAFGLDSYVPVSVLIAGALSAVLLIGLARFQSRLFAFRRAGLGSGVRVAVVGAGTEAASALREMQHDPQLGLVPVVAVDDDPTLRWRSIHGVPIAGPMDDFDEILAAYDVGQILVALPDPSRALVRHIADIAEVMQVPVRILRPSGSWVHGMPRFRGVRDLDIEDLLGRVQVDVDLEPVRRLLEGRRVLVTGGGGWIGSEIARQVASFSPARLVLLDHDETHLHDALYGIEGEMALADIRDSSVIDAVFARVRPEVVFHTAAHKHVPVLEDYACEAVRTNVFGTLNVVEACRRFGTRELVCISTDKAATPTSVMGATKWLAEQLVLTQAPDGSCSVRFGNVLGSRGSVIPTFQHQIAAGGPVTVTDRAMTRYFMNTDEAVRLVLHAAAVSVGRSVLALEMGEQVNIYELAERMIRLCGSTPHSDIEIRITGLRPGENLTEALVGPAEEREPTDDGTIMRIRPVHLSEARLSEVLDELGARVVVGDHDGVKSLLREVVTRTAMPSGMPAAHA